MREIGVRELKETLSKTLRAVGRGEQVRVTVRGRALVDIVPAGAAAPDASWRRLVAEGRVVPAERPPPDDAPPLATAKSAHSASALVLAERDDELDTERH